MKKIGIITIPDYNNYGNRLQNYAVKRFFEKKNFIVETLEMNDKDFKQYKARRFKLSLKKYKLWTLVFLYEYLRGGEKKAQRYEKFQMFTRKYLNPRYLPSYTDRVIKDVVKQYDYIVLGSDQIWHPTVNTTPNLFFATFMPENKKLYFSPSFGLDELPKQYEEIVARGICQSDNLTVREESGAAIIDRLVQKKAKVLPDPTYALTAGEWEKVAKKPQHFMKEPYILRCFLGNMSNEYQEFMNTICQNMSLSIFELADKEHPEGYVTGPSEFVYSIMNSELVLTDSFHTVVFALIFHIPFIVFSRLNANGENAGIDTRIDTLLKKFKLMDRKYKGTYIPPFYECDYKYIDEMFLQERQKIISYFESV